VVYGKSDNLNYDKYFILQENLFVEDYAILSEHNIIGMEGHLICFKLGDFSVFNKSMLLTNFHILYKENG
jgi:hypothetical protein